MENKDLYKPEEVAKIVEYSVKLCVDRFRIDVEVGKKSPEHFQESLRGLYGKLQVYTGEVPENVQGLLTNTVDAEEIEYHCDTFIIK